MALVGSDAVVTGARGGIGMAVVEALASRGANVWACARKQDDGYEERLGQLAQEHGVEIRPLYFDLANKDEIKAAVQEIFATKVYPSILVNNAGVAHAALFQMTPVDQIRAVFESNLFGHMELTQLLLRGMRRNASGSIVNTASIEALESAEGNSAYGASKAAMIAWTNTLAVELASSNIRVNAVAPGLTHTSISENQNAGAFERHVNASAQKRLGEPSEIAAVIAFLSSDESSFVNGETIRIDGGWKSY